MFCIKIHWLKFIEFLIICRLCHFEQMQHQLLLLGINRRLGICYYSLPVSLSLFLFFRAVIDIHGKLRTIFIRTTFKICLFLTHLNWVPVANNYIDETNEDSVKKGQYHKTHYHGTLWQNKNKKFFDVLQDSYYRYPTIALNNLSWLGFLC